MIAPDPVPAGPLPAAPPRETPRPAGAERRRGEDFDSVLKEPPAEEARELEGARPDAVSSPFDPTPALAALGPTAPVPAAPVPAAPTHQAEALPSGGVAAPVVAAPAPAPAAPVPTAGAAAPEPAAPGQAAGSVRAAEVAPAEVAAAEVAGTEVAGSEVAGAEVAAAEVAGAGSEKAAPDPGQGKGTRPGAVPAVAGPKALTVEQPIAEPTEKRPGEPAGEPALERVDAPAVKAAPAETRARAVAEAVAPAAPAGEEAGRGVVRAEAAPPAWHLGPEPQGPARADAAAQALAQPPVPAISPQVVAGQVAVAIDRASDDRLEIRLDPPELGRVQIHLTRHDGAIQAVVLADWPETQDLLRRHAEVLARELGEAGYDSVSLDFAGGGAQSRPDDPSGRDWRQVAARSAAIEPAAAVAPALSPGPRPARIAAGGLDIRL